MLDLQDKAEREWLREIVEQLKTEHAILTPTEWACATRYLPREVTAMSGPYDVSVTPYIEEILDCMGPLSPIREIDFQKGAQVCATVGILENAIGYIIEHVQDSVAMLVTADLELAEARVNNYIVPMLTHSNLMDRIQSNDETDKRRTGRTKKRLQWKGGGSLIPAGALSPNRFRSESVKFLLLDEVDSFPLTCGVEGDPLELAKQRTSSFETTRKILRLSTPTDENTSRIAEGFKRGDQRYYNVPCKSCGELQVFRWRGTRDDGSRYGVIWETDENGHLVPDSARYVCKHCGHKHRNSDKAWMMAKENGARWVPTAKPLHSTYRSYHLSALYSPPGLRSWDECVLAWLGAWDVERDQVRDPGKLQVFYNTILGEPFRVATGGKLEFTTVSKHRRPEYRLGEVPSELALTATGGRVELLTLTVDVHKGFLACAVFGWCQQGRSFLIDHVILNDSDCTSHDSPVWAELQDLIENRVYVSEELEYPIALTLIDAGYTPAVVYDFCAEYSSGVYPIVGRPPGKSQGAVKEFSPFTTQKGTPGFKINVDHYKDRCASALRRDWDAASGAQPSYMLNLPIDLGDAYVKELTAEVRREETTKDGRVFYTWHRTGARNELWDLWVYGNAALEMLAFDVCTKVLELDGVDWLEFFAFCRRSRVYAREV